MWYWWFATGFLSGVAAICTLLAVWAYFWPERGKHG